MEIKVEKRGHKDIKGTKAPRKTRIYVWAEGESILDNLVLRRCRPYTFYKKEVIPRLWKSLGVENPPKVRWSQYAGCSCPCSPGFIVDGDLPEYCDYHVTVGCEG